jgi:hypothetical protein
VQHPGNSPNSLGAALKLLGRDTGDSIMLFEEAAPAGRYVDAETGKPVDEEDQVQRL